jgi:hypothetical protein
VKSAKKNSMRTESFSVEYFSWLKDCLLDFQMWLTLVIKLDDKKRRTLINQGYSAALFKPSCQLRLLKALAI